MVRLKTLALTLLVLLYASTLLAQRQGLLLVPPTVTLVQQATPLGTASPGASVAINLPANATVNNLVVFAEGSQGGNPVTSISVFGTTATKVLETRTNSQVGIWAITVPQAGATATVNLTNGNPFGVTMTEFSLSGANWGSPFVSDPNAPASTQGTAGTFGYTPMFSTTNQWELLFGMASQGGAQTMTSANSDWTELRHTALTGGSVIAAYRFFPQGGTYQDLFTNIGSGSFWGTAVAGFEVQ